MRYRARWVVGKVGGWETSDPLRRLQFESGGEADVAGRERGIADLGGFKAGEAEENAIVANGSSMMREVAALAVGGRRNDLGKMVTPKRVLPK